MPFDKPSLDGILMEKGVGVHRRVRGNDIRWGKSTAAYPPRVAEIRAVARAVKDRAGSPHAWSDHHILSGDLNIFKTEDETFKELTKAGFHIRPEIQEKPSNAPKTKHYDQIAFMTRSLGKLIEKNHTECGVFDFFSVVYRDEDANVFRKDDDEYVAKPNAATSTYALWRTHQMSDHLPMWVRLWTDHTEEYLKEFRMGMKKGMRVGRGEVDNGGSGGKFRFRLRLRSDFELLGAGWTNPSNSTAVRDLRFGVR